jgi:hypothetical protein
LEQGIKLRKVAELQEPLSALEAKMVPEGCFEVTVRGMGRDAMSFRRSFLKRLQGLERAMAARNPPLPCPHCRDWHWVQIETKTALELVNGGGQETEVTSCPACGWAPRKFVEVVVDSKEELAACAREPGS